MEVSSCLRQHLERDLADPGRHGGGFQAMLLEDEQERTR